MTRRMAAVSGSIRTIPPLINRGELGKELMLEEHLQAKGGRTGARRGVAILVAQRDLAESADLPPWFCALVLLLILDRTHGIGERADRFAQIDLGLHFR